MLFRLRRWYNQNSKKIWKVTGIVVFFLIILRLLNYYAGHKAEVKYNPDIDISTRNEYTDLSLSTDKSVLSDKELSSTQLSSIDTINKFFAFCNQGKVNDAYNLLTDECKKEMYPRVEYFNKNYYKVIFNGERKNISLENWTGNIYKVNITGELLSSGGKDGNEVRQDFITIKEVNNTYKLNINNYIETVKINKSNTFYNNIEINVQEKDVYMDYEIYTFSIKNKMDTPILLDDLKRIDSMYLEDKNNIQYAAYTHEISKGQLLINSNETRTIKIKYYNKFESEKKIERVKFSRVIIDYYTYISIEGSKEFNNYREFNVEI